MVVSELKHDPALIRTCFKKSKDKYIAEKEFKVYVPEYYEKTDLLDITDGVRIIGVFGIVHEDKYAVSKSISIIHTKPSDINMEIVDNMRYKVFTYQKGDVYMDNINLVRNKVLGFAIFNELIFKAKIPFYLTYPYVTTFMDSSEHTANANKGVDEAVLELICAEVARDPNDLSVHYRETIRSKADLAEKRPQYVSLRFVPLNVNSTTSLLGGPYFQSGLTGALVHDRKENELMEDIFRS